ncbi:MAG: hypothetical protein QOH63_679 [Acidobacteriota bacterium]|jgi:hypothetical protein|nr:hypothetical protein [Acidobacteriota bacterium]
MLVECVPRPELKGPVLDLIRRVSTEHTEDEFAIPLAEMFESFGLSLADAEWDKLRARGEVRFTPRGASQGEFSNEGRKQELATGEGLTLVIPETLAGAYVTTPTSLTLKFAEGSALRGCKRVFVLICQDIIKIDADEHKLYIDLPGEKYDLCFIF